MVEQMTQEKKDEIRQLIEEIRGLTDGICKKIDNRFRSK